MYSVCVRVEFAGRSGPVLREPGRPVAAVALPGGGAGEGLEAEPAL